MTTVTIGIPFVNDARTLPLAVRSVFSQTHTDWLLVLMDDGSRDGSLDFARSVADERVTVVSDGENLGLAARLNQLARRCTTEWLARMDADDAMHPERIRLQLQYGDSEGSQVVATSAFAFDENDHVYGMQSTGGAPGSPREFLTNRTFVHPTILARTKWFRDNRYDESLLKGQDKELWLRTHGSTRIGKLQQPLLFYRDLGTFSMARYSETCHFDRRIVSEYGPTIVGAWQTRKLILDSYAKQAIHFLLEHTPLHSRLVRRRSEPISSEQRAGASEALRQIQSTTIPLRARRDRLAETETEGGPR